MRTRRARRIEEAASEPPAAEPEAAVNNAAFLPGANPGANPGRPKVLCLGVSYASMYSQLDEYGIDRETYLEGRDYLVVEDVIAAVLDGYLTEMDARDLARVVATESLCRADLYTVSQENAARYDKNRHLYANFNRHRILDSLHFAFAENRNGERQDEDMYGRIDEDYQVQFRQTILDYYWIPSGWNTTRWRPSLFRETIPGLVTNKLMDMDERPGDLPCGIYLPFCLHCFRQVISALPLLSEYFAIYFLRIEDLPEVSLWAGTQTIDADKMQHVLGKQLDQENIYCTFGYREVMGCGYVNGDATKEKMLEILKKLDDFDDIRMIKLRPLQQHHPTKSFPKEAGGLKGLTDPELVRNGMKMTMAKGDDKNEVSASSEASSDDSSVAPSNDSDDDSDDAGTTANRKGVSSVATAKLPPKRNRSMSTSTKRPRLGSVSNGAAKRQRLTFIVSEDEDSKPAAKPKKEAGGKGNKAQGVKKPVAAALDSSLSRAARAQRRASAKEDSKPAKKSKNAATTHNQKKPYSAASKSTTTASDARASRRQRRAESKEASKPSSDEAEFASARKTLSFDVVQDSPFSAKASMKSSSGNLKKPPPVASLPKKILEESDLTDEESVQNHAISSKLPSVQKPDGKMNTNASSKKNAKDFQPKNTAPNRSQKKPTPVDHSHGVGTKSVVRPLSSADDSLEPESSIGCTTVEYDSSRGDEGFEDGGTFSAGESSKQSESLGELDTGRETKFSLTNRVDRQQLAENDNRKQEILEKSKAQDTKENPLSYSKFHKNGQQRRPAHAKQIPKAVTPSPDPHGTNCSEETEVAKQPARRLLFSESDPKQKPVSQHDTKNANQKRSQNHKYKKSQQQPRNKNSTSKVQDTKEKEKDPAPSKRFLALQALLDSKGEKKPASNENTNGREKIHPKTQNRKKRKSDSIRKARETQLSEDRFNGRKKSPKGNSVLPQKYAISSQRVAPSDSRKSNSNHDNGESKLHDVDEAPSLTGGKVFPWDDNTGDDSRISHDTDNDLAMVDDEESLVQDRQEDARKKEVEDGNIKPLPLSTKQALDEQLHHAPAKSLDSITKEPSKFPEELEQLQKSLPKGNLPHSSPPRTKHARKLAAENEHSKQLSKKQDQAQGISQDAQHGGNANRDLDLKESVHHNDPYYEESLTMPAQDAPAAPTAKVTNKMKKKAQNELESESAPPTPIEQQVKESPKENEAKAEGSPLKWPEKKPKKETPFMTSTKKKEKKTQNELAIESTPPTSIEQKQSPEKDDARVEGSPLKTPKKDKATATPTRRSARKPTDETNTSPYSWYGAARRFNESISLPKRYSTETGKSSPKRATKKDKTVESKGKDESTHSPPQVKRVKTPVWETNPRQSASTKKFLETKRKRRLSLGKSRSSLPRQIEIPSIEGKTNFVSKAEKQADYDVGLQLKDSLDFSESLNFSERT